VGPDKEDEYKQRHLDAVTISLMREVLPDLVFTSSCLETVLKNFAQYTHSAPKHVWVVEAGRSTQELRTAVVDLKGQRDLLTGVIARLEALETVGE
jgi:hypothetical protein